MTIHICRDFLTLPSTYPSSSMYLSSIFLLHVGRYTQIGNTAFNLTGSLLVATGSGASINLGISGSYNTVIIPSSTYTISTSDVNNILALRSTSYPRHNSGLFRISSVDTVNNRVNVEYRSTENPPIESSTLEWAIFLHENAISGSMSNAGGIPYGTGYTSKWNYGDKRIILQSPHSSSWQVRYCWESSIDRTNLSIQCSVAPGFDGDSKGDFLTGSFDTSITPAKHLHGAHWYNLSSQYYNGTVVGITKYNATDYTNTQTRMYAWVDDVSGSACFITRNVANYSANTWYSFGLAEDDELSSTQTLDKLFVMGIASNQVSTIGWKNGPAGSLGYTGLAYSTNQNMPVNCVWSLYDYVGNVNGGSTYGEGIKAESLATDNQLLGATELQKVDLWAGTSDSGNSLSNFPLYSVLRFDPRRVGSMPIARVGRSNFGNWITTNDSNKSWIHITNGVYLPWQGPGLYL